MDVNFLNELLGLPAILERKLGVKNAKLDSRLAKQMGLKSGNVSRSIRSALYRSCIFAVNFNSNFTTASLEVNKYRSVVAEFGGAEAETVRARRCVIIIFLFLL